MSLRTNHELTVVELEFYNKILKALVASEIPFLVGGAYALGYYTGISRHTLDLDIFIKPENWPPVKRLIEDMDYYVELMFSHWLGKAFFGDNYIDIIFSSGNAVATVDDAWFDRAKRDVILGVEVAIVPPEEIIWQKCYIMERERFDGADVAHLIKSCGRDLDWPHLLKRFENDWRVLLSHLVLFGYIFPGDRDLVPNEVMQGLFHRWASEPPASTEQLESCFGTMLSRDQYLFDINQKGYRDPRKKPAGNMSVEQIRHWTAAIS